MPRTRRAVGLKVTESATQSIVLSVPEDLKVPTVRRWSAGRRSPREQPGVAGRSGGRRGQTWATGMEPLSQPAGRGEPPPRVVHPVFARAGSAGSLPVPGNPCGGHVQGKGEQARGRRRVSRQLIPPRVHHS